MSAQKGKLDRRTVHPQAAFAYGITRFDDRFPERQKMVVSFTLPRGSYATLVLKALVA